MVMKNPLLLLVIAISFLLESSCGKKEDSVAEIKPAKAAGQPLTDNQGEPSSTSSHDADITQKVAQARDLIANYGGDRADLAKAREILTGVLGSSRDYAPAYVELARLEYKSGYVSGDAFDRTRLINAEKFANHALELDPDLPEAHLASARISLYLGEFDLSNERIETAESLGVAKEDADAVRARMASATGDERETLRLARTVIASESAAKPLKLEMLMLIAPILERGGFRAEAQEALEDVVALDSRSAWGHGNLAAFLLRHGEITRAVEHAERAVEILPYPIGVNTLVRAYVARAEQLYSERRFAEAGRMIERLSDGLVGEDPDALGAIGDYYYRVFIRTSDPMFLDRAAEKYRAALSLDPTRIELSRSLDRVLQRRAEIANGS